LAEFAIVLPVLLLAVLIALDFGRALYGWVVLQNAARIAANYAGLYPAGWRDGDAAIQAEYETLVERDQNTANCTPPSSPAAPVFQDGPDTFIAGGNPDTVYDVGDTVRVDLSCDFRPLTPIISAITGTVVTLRAGSEFRIRAGEITGLAHATAMPPPAAPTPTPTPTPGATPTPTPTPVVCSNPVANFSGTPTSGGGGQLSVTFTDTSSTTAGCPITSWLWDFGDGQTSTQQNPPIHLFIKTSPGSQQRFTVELTVQLAGGQNDNERKNNYITVQN
jgi:PKD repeat protein